MYKPAIPLLLWTLSAFAQTPSSAPKTVVVVTATRTETEMDKAPASTSVVTRDEMRVRNNQTLDQSLNLLTGISVLRTKGAMDNSTRLMVRGFNGANRTLVLLDGQPVNDAYTGDISWTSLPVGEVDRVEVVRGPFSSLYGGNAMGGVVNILTRPVDRREIELTGQYGTYDTANYGARYSDRFFGKLGVSLGYQRLQSGGYASRNILSAATTGTTGTLVTGVVPTLTTTGGRTYQVGWSGDNWYNQHSYRLKGDYAFNDRTILTLQYIRQSSAYGYDDFSSSLRDAGGNVLIRGPVLFDDGGVTRRLNFTPGNFIQGPGNAHSNLVSGSLQHKFNSRNYLRLTGGVYDQPVNNTRTPTAATATMDGGPGSLSLRGSRNYYGNVQYNWILSSRHDFVFGADTRNEWSANQDFGLSNWIVEGARIAQTYGAYGRTVNQAFYAQDQFKLTERLTLVAGGRYDYFKTYDGFNNTFTGTAPLTAYPERVNNSLTGKLSAVYAAPRGWTLRASLGTAFRNPTVYELYRTFRLSSGANFIANPNLAPEKLLSYEGGLTKRFGEGTLIEASLFRNHIKDLIYRKTDFAADPNGLIRPLVNAGEGRTTGAEASLRQRITSWLQFRTSYTYTKALITRNPAVVETEGKFIPFIPEHMFNASMLGSWKRWTGSASFRYTGNVFSSDTNNDTTKGVAGAYGAYAVGDASIGYQLQRNVQVFASAENLLDRQHYLFYLNPGRTVNVGLRIRLNP